MNYRMIFHMVGQITKLEAALLLLPTCVALLYRESCVFALLFTAVFALCVGFAFTLFSRPRSQVIFAKEGFVIVALAWMLLSAIGAIPFCLTREIPSYIDAFFETVSGFTTTGASILTDVESMSRGLLFWRSFTHWIGGMGVLVLIMALLPTGSGRSIHIMRAEVPGVTVGKLAPRLRDTAKILYLIYIALTLVEIGFLLAGGMSAFDSVVHAFGTAGTGGFGIRADSIAGYSPYLQWVITVFMLLFGVNFNVYFLLVMRHFGKALRNGELWMYLCIVLCATGLITLNTVSLYNGVGETVRHAAFQVSSIITTTGYATTDFNLWPDFSKAILLALMFVGGCAGSTAGGLKVSRILLLFKTFRRDLQRQLHPHAVGAIKLDGKRLDDGAVQSVSAYILLYFVVFGAGFLLLSLEPFGLETNFSAMAACLNNVGPGFAAVGPAGNFSIYSGFSTLLLSLAMLLGRLEIYALLLTLTPSTWLKE